MADFAKLTVQLGGNISGLKKSLKKAQVLSSTFSKNVTRTFNEAAAAGSKGFKNMLRNDAFQASAVAAGGIGLALRRSVQVAMEFEAAMSSVQSKLRPTTKEFGQLNALAKEMGRTTKFTAAETAGAFDFLAQAGYNTNQILKSTPGILNLATAANMDIAEAADITSNILGGMGLKIKDTGNLVDLLAKTAVSGNVDIRMLGESFKYVAPLAAAAGVSAEQLGASFTLLGNAGIQASEGGTAMRSILDRLSAPPKEAAKALAQLGVATKDSEGNLRPFVTVLKDMEAAMDAANLGTAERLEVQKKLFGKTAMAAGAILQEAAANGTLAEQVKKVSDNQGAAGEMAKTMQNNFAGAMTRLQSAMDGLLNSLGTPLLMPLASLAEAIGVIIQPISWLLTNVPLLGGAVGLLAASFAGLVIAAPFISGITAAVGILKTAMLGLAASKFIAPILLNFKTLAIVGKTAFVVLGKAALAAALPFIIVGAKIIAVGAAIFGIVKLIQHLWNTNEGFRNAVTGAWNAIVGAVTGAISGIANFATGVFNNVVGFIQEHGNKILAIMFPLPSLIAGAFGKLPADVQPHFDNMVAFIKGIPAKLVDVGKAIINTIIDGVKERASALVDTVKGTLQQVREMLPFSDAKKGPLASLTENGENILKTMSQGMASQQGTLTDQFRIAATGGVGQVKGMVGTLVQTFREVPQLVGDVGELIIDTVIAGLQRKAGALFQTVKGIFQNVRNLLPFSDAKEGPFSQLTLAGASIITTLMDGIRAAAPMLSPTLAGGLAAATPVIDAVLPQPAAATAGASAAPVTINSPVTINVASTDATADDIATQVQLVFSNILDDAEAGVRAFLND